MCLCNTDVPVAINPKLDILRIKSHFKVIGLSTLGMFLFAEYAYNI